MSPRIALLTAIALSASLSAQAVTSPKGFLNTEGNSNATFGLGSYRDGRFQYSDGTHVGTAMLIKGTAVRHGNYAYTTSTGMGRSWTNVTIMASECKGSALTSTFTNNPLSAPTNVFSAAVNWPTQSGKPKTFPAPFSLNFPFQKSWSYSGKDHMCLDYFFSGGKLANGQTWTSSGSKPYYFDAQNTGSSSYRDSTYYGDYYTNGGCNDRSTTNVLGAQIWTRATVYGPQYSNSTQRNKIVFTQNGRYFPSSGPVLTVLGLRSNAAGTSFAGITCNKVHIDLRLPIFFIPSFSNASGNLIALNLSANNPGVAAVELVTQCIWNDRVTQQPLLSNAAGVWVPKGPGSQPANLLYHYNSSSRTGFRSNSQSYQPVVRYAR